MQIDDEEYLKIVSDILNDSRFLNLKSFVHHGVNRYELSLKVSYKAYKYAKAKKLDYIAVARGGLLHDFFENSSNAKAKERFFKTFTHSKIALENASQKFNINALEADIIVSHMFPINSIIPKHKESWLVSLVDKKIGLCEWGAKFKYQACYLSNFIVLLLFNSIK